MEIPTGYRAGGWRVAERIASGSWASVYAARREQRPSAPGDLPHGARGALKFLRSGTLSPTQYAAIGEEVRFSEQADHPGLIRTFETFVVDDPATPELHGAVVLAMERADRSLQDVLATIECAEAQRIVAEICDALAHMHAAGWVHGDLKPSNVLLMADGSVRLADFGLARELDGTHAYAPRLGSSDYLPPEWWSERISQQGVAVRPTADIWALGVTAHQLLTGGLFPFAGATPRARVAAAQAYADGQAELRLADELPAAWRPIVADCLAADHAARLEHDAASLRARIRALAEEGGGDRAAARAGGLRPGATALGRGLLRGTKARVAMGALALAVASAGAVIATNGDAPAPRGAGLKVYNAEAKCRHSPSPNCRLGLAGDPYEKYAPANVVGHARHGDRLVAECWIADGVPVMSEDHRTSTRWYRVRTADEAAWLPAVRAWPGVTPPVGRCAT